MLVGQRKCQTVLSHSLSQVKISKYVVTGGRSLAEDIWILDTGVGGRRNKSLGVTLWQLVQTNKAS